MVTVKEIYDYSTKKLKLRNYKSEKNYYRNAPLIETTVYLVGKKKLIFIGGLHVYGKNPFVRFLKNIFDKIRPQLLLLEASVDIPPAYLLRSLEKPTSKWGEVQWAIHFAQKHKIDFRGMDAKSDALFKPFVEMEDKDGIKAGILIWVMNYYDNPYRRMLKGLSKEDYYNFAVNELIRDFLFPNGKFKNFRNQFLKLRKKYKNSSLVDFVKEVVQEATNKYIEKKPFLSLIDKESVMAPYPFNTRYKINKIRTWWSSYRDKSMIDESVKSLKEKDRVIALAGCGHIRTIRELLAKEMKKEFGKIEVLSWEEYAKLYF